MDMEEDFSGADKPAFSASIRHLKVFESVAQLHGVRKASEEFHLSQPAVTQAIAKLEKQLGVALLERRPSGSYLNAFGKMFQRRIQRMFAQIDEALVELGVPNGSTPVSRIASCITRSQVRSLIAVVENGSFANAARALSISQTSLQRAARDLERTLRTPLYLQTSSGIVATPSAAELARKLKLALREVEWGVEEIETARGNVGGEIVIGAMMLSGSVVLATVLNEFANAYPNANIRVHNGNAEDMLRSLRCGDVDFVIGLVREPTPDGMVNELLAETPYVVAARHGHPLMEKRPVTLDDLAAYEWVVATPGAHRLARFEQLFAGRKRPRAHIATSSLPTMRALLAQSDRLTLLTSYEVMYEDDALTALSFGPLDPAPAIGLTMRENWLPTQLQKSCVELIQKRVLDAVNSGQKLSTELKRLGLRLHDYQA